VKPGDRVLIDDGNIRLQVKTIHKDEITLTVMVDGIMKPSKGINLPGVDVSSPALTEKDREDLKFALTLPVDYVALSFVRKPEDVLEARRIIHQEGLHIPVISKIEREEAVHCIEDILHVSEGVMVARGDMGVELSPERVPAIQKRIIRLANQMDKTVIVATQMLESMIDKPIPTRAEASDVANAILDGADCTMLSGETAAGKYPFEAVKMMERIGFEAENFFISDRLVRRDDDKYQNSAFYSSDAVCKAAVTTARQVGAKAIVTFTSSGKTALLVSKQKPDMPILAVTFTEEVARRMNMYWGVETVIINKAESTDEMIHMAAGAALETGTAQPGDFIVITAGIPAGRPGATNLIKLHRIACHPKNVNDQEVFEMPEGKLLLKRGRCIGCGYCPAICPFGVYSMIDERVYVNKEKLHLCTRDGRCADGCPTHVIEFK
jgi:pyruvate kinase